MRRASRAVLAGLLLLAPLPFGSVQDWSSALLAAGLGLALALAAAGRMRLPQPLPPGTRAVAAGAALLALPGLLQLMPLPPGLLRLVSPTTAELYARFAPDPTAWRPLSLEPAATHGTLLWLGGCAAAALVVLLAHDRGSLRRLLPVLIAVGVFQAFYGLLEYLSGRNRIFLYEKRYYLESVTGTYINRNHLAGLLLMIMPIGLAWLLARRRRASPSGRTWKETLLAWSEGHSMQDLLLGLALAVMGAGLGLSFSRAGVGIAALALALTLVLAVLTAPGSPFRRSRGAWLAAGLLAAMALLPLAARGPGRLASVAEDIPAELSAASGRPAAWAAALRSGLEQPLLGSGLGTFELDWARHRPVAVQSEYTHAHQDFLQWFAETGLLGSLAGLVVLAGLAFICRRALAAPHPGDRLLAAGLSAALLGMALHGLVDFNGHIPANTFIASVLAAMLVVLAHAPRTHADALTGGGAR